MATTTKQTTQKLLTAYLQEAKKLGKRNMAVKEAFMKAEAKLVDEVVSLQKKVFTDVKKKYDYLEQELKIIQMIAQSKKKLTDWSNASLDWWGQTMAAEKDLLTSYRETVTGCVQAY